MNHGGVSYWGQRTRDVNLYYELSSFPATDPSQDPKAMKMSVHSELSGDFETLRLLTSRLHSTLAVLRVPLPP